MAEPNGEKLTTITGLTVITAGGAFIHLASVPWWAGLIVVGVGLYLTLPNKMRTVGTDIMDIFDRFRSGPAPYEPIGEERVNPEIAPEPLEPRQE